LEESERLGCGNTISAAICALSGVLGDEAEPHGIRNFALKIRKYSGLSKLAVALGVDAAEAPKGPTTASYSIKPIE
jgi:hypothetical protein